MDKWDWVICINKIQAILACIAMFLLIGIVVIVCIASFFTKLWFIGVLTLILMIWLILDLIKDLIR